MMLEDIWADLANPKNINAHLAYVFIIASMSMTQMRWLRILALAGGITAMLHFFLQTQETVSLVWEAIFTLTNAAQLALLLYQSRQVSMSSEQRSFAEGPLAGLDPANVRALLAISVWENVGPETCLMQEGEVAPPLIHVVSGAAAIEHQGRIVGVCGPGDFLGEMSLLRGAPASATVRVTNQMRIIRFDRAALDGLRTGSQQLRTTLDRAFNHGLASKIERMNAAVGA
jgi:CRP-like cAMP-binding protein